MEAAKIAVCCVLRQPHAGGRRSSTSWRLEEILQLLDLYSCQPQNSAERSRFEHLSSVNRHRKGPGRAIGFVTAKLYMTASLSDNQKPCPFKGSYEFCAGQPRELRH